MVPTFMSGRLIIGSRQIHINGYGLCPQHLDCTPCSEKLRGMIFNMSTSRISVSSVVHLLSFISHLQPRCYLHDSLTFDETSHVAGSRE